MPEMGAAATFTSEAAIQIKVAIGDAVIDS